MERRSKNWDETVKISQAAEQKATEESKKAVEEAVKATKRDSAKSEESKKAEGTAAK